MKKTNNKLKSSGVEKLKSTSPINLSTSQPFNLSTSRQDAATAKQLMDQYRIVVAAERSCFRERVKFGAMLIMWERFLGESRGGAGGGSGEGLKGWLEEHCPELGYDTAMKYKYSAERAIAMLGGGAMATAALLGRDEVTQPDGEVVDVDDATAKKCDELFEDATSRRKLEQMYFDFVEKEKRRERRRNTGDIAESKLKAHRVLSLRKSAAILWGDAMKPFEAKRGAFFSAAKNLDHDLAASWLEELKMLCDVLQKRIDAVK